MTSTPQPDPATTSLPTAQRVLYQGGGIRGLRFRVRGLLDRPAVARRLESTLRARHRIVAHASASTGLVRLVVPQPADIRVWQSRLSQLVEECLPAGYAAAAVAPAPPSRSTPAAGTARPPPGVSRMSENAKPAAAPAAAMVAADRRATRRLDEPFTLPVTTLLQRLGTRAAGLGADEAAERLARLGPNEILDIRGRDDLEILLGQFNSVPVALLGASGVVALATRALGDAAAIGAVLAANGALGYFTERRAEQTVSSLRRLAPRQATVLRDGVPMQVPAREVVVGDVLVLKPGESVAADARVLEAHRLSTNEAALTGESLPVRKHADATVTGGAPLGQRTNMVHLGTVVSGGAGLAVVTGTGADTALGAIRALAQGAEAPRTRMQGELDELGKWLAIGATGLCVAVFGMGLLRGRPVLPLLRAAVSLGVAAIPEGLPTVATSLLAAGIRNLESKRVYARRLDAVENLGAIDIVCFDKTGTLTENRMRTASIVLGDRVLRLDGPERNTPPLPPEWGLVLALCNDLERGAEVLPGVVAAAAPPGTLAGWSGSSTELALLAFAIEQGVDPDALRARHPRVDVKQRSEHHPYMVTLHDGQVAGRPGVQAGGGAGRGFVAVKGRPAEVLDRCIAWHDGRRAVPLDAAKRRELLEANQRLAGFGHRVLALACRHRGGRHLQGETSGLTWLGLIGLADPVRTGVADSIARFRRAGIRPLMLTGDQVPTADAVAHEIGLADGGSMIDAGPLKESAAELQEAADRAYGFARSTPAMKLELVRALQAQRHVVAMTGDGINDGPALKMADVGVAMGGAGTDFAHAMSDLVLQDDHPDGLLIAIAEGRTAYLNVKKAVRYLVATNLSELTVMTASMALGLPDPFDPIALLWTNLVTDVSPAIALGLEPPEPDILERPPFPRTRGLLDRSDWRRVLLDSGAMSIATLTSFGYGLSRYGPGPQARTLAFMTLTTGQLLYALTARSENRVANGRLRSNKLLTRVTLLSLAAQAATVLLPPLRGVLRTTPLGPVDWLVVAGTAVLPALLREASKATLSTPPVTGRAPAART